MTSFRSFFQSSFQPTNKDYLDSYDSCHLVHTCVKKIGEAVAKTELRLFKVKGSAGNEKVDEVVNSPLLDLLDKPNKFQTRFEFFKEISISIDLLGNAYILKARNDSGKVLELWLLRADKIKIVADEKEVIGGYEFITDDGRTIFYPQEDIIHIKETNPKSFFYGLPVVRPAIEVIKSLVFSVRWNMNFFYNSARPDFVVFTKNRLPDADRDEFKRNWDEHHKGLENAHRWGMLYGEDTKIETLTPSIRDMEFSNLTETTTNQIISAFGVPKAIIGMQGMNRAEAEAQIFTFLSQTVEPRLKMIVDKINEFLVIDFGQEFFLEFVDPTPENREAITKEYDSALTQHWMVINEVRDREGLPPLEGGWDFYLPINQVAVGGVPAGDQNRGYALIKGITPKKYYKDKEDREQAKLLKRVLAGKKNLKRMMLLKKDITDIYLEALKKENKFKIDEDKKKELWQEFDKTVAANEKRFNLVIVALLKEQRERILRALEEQFKSLKKAKTDLVNWKEEEKIFIRVALPIFTDIIKESGDREALFIGERFEINKDVENFINTKTVKFAETVNETTRLALKKTLNEGLKAGEGIPDLAKRVNVLFDNRMGFESVRIARTEVVGSANGAAELVYKQSKVIEKKEWLTTMDDKVRDSHASLNGQVVGKDKRFRNGLRYPGDSSGSASETVNCRCTLLPVI